MTMQDTVANFRALCLALGWSQASHHYGKPESELTDADVFAAEAAVLALFAKQQAVVDELAKALEEGKAAVEWADAALAHYRELEGK